MSRWLLSLLLLLPLNVSAQTGNLSGGSVKATGGSTARTLADRAVDSINVLDYGVSGAAVDRTGATDTSGAFLAAVTVACTSRQKKLYVPGGLYLINSNFSATGHSCDHLTIEFDPSAQLQIGASNTSNPAIANFTGIDYLTLVNFRVDGNTANVLTGNLHPAVQVAQPTKYFTCLNCEWRNLSATALNVVGDQPISATTAVQANPNQAAMTLASIPSGLKPGAMIVNSATIDPDMYVTGISGSVLTWNRNLTDTTINGTTVQFTHAFTLSADAKYGDTILSTSSTTGLTVGQTLFQPTSGCLVTTTRILSIVTNTSVTIDEPIQCSNGMTSGTNIAAAAGNAFMKLINPVFDEIGQVQLNLGGTRNYTVAADSPAGNTLHLNCLTGANCSSAVPFPGQMTGPSGLPAGVPANDLVTGQTCNLGAGTCDVTLQSPLTQTVTAAASVPFTFAGAGAGYGVWYSWGAPFANYGSQIVNIVARHTFTAPIFLSSKNLLIEGGHIVEDYMEYRDQVIAPSPCVAAGGNDGLRLIGLTCRGATGQGVEAQHAINSQIVGGSYNENGLNGVEFMGGHDITIGNGAQFKNNGQFVNFPYASNLYAAGYPGASGVSLGSTGTFGQAGTIFNVSINGISASDTQAAPTQYFGVGAARTIGLTGSGMNIDIPSVAGSGNITSLIDTLISGQQSQVSLPSRQAICVGTDAAAGNGADLTEDAMASCVVPANTLHDVGQVLHISASGAYAASTDTKTAFVRYSLINGNALCGPAGSTLSALHWSCEVWIVKTGAGTQNFFSLSSVQNGTGNGTNSGTTGWNDAGSTTIVFSGKNATNSVAGSVAIQSYLVEILR